MAHAASGFVVQQIGSLFEGGSVAGLSDRQLLDRFVAHRDAAAEAAFAALVTRHGPMVLHVCRQLLGDHQHAEDAFQAVFLVLARRARSVRDPDRLSHWLYGVALRTARKARSRLARRRKQEKNDAGNGPDPTSGLPADQSAMAREQAEILHDEIDRLPNAFRLPVVLCYFEGLTLDEAARRLSWPQGTLRSRLARARDKLRRGLVRRGVVLPAAAIATILEARPASASVSSSLCDITTRAAMNFADGQAATTAASALAQEVLRSMLVNKLKLAVLVLFVVGALAGGAGFLQAHQAGKPDRPRQAGKPDRPAADANPQPAPGRMFVVGRVLDPSGKPVPDASVAVYARRLTPDLPLYLRSRRPLPIGDARADGSGRFRIDAPRISSSRYEAFGAIALAPGYGAGWVELNPDDDQPTADITLRPEQVVQGRLFDVQGQPAANVLLSVSAIHRNLPPPQAGRRRFPDGVFYSGTKVNDLPAWPKPMTTDAEGRFTLRGLGPGLAAGLTVHDPRFARHNIGVRADDASKSKPVTAALVPAQVLAGRVTYADTGKAVPHAPLEVRSSYGRAVITSEFETDADGRFRVNPPPADRVYTIIAFPPEGQPYLTASARIEWPKGALEQKADLALPRGVLIYGKVTEEGSGKPVAGATVDFWARGPRIYQQGGNLAVETATDGSFQLGVKPSPGYLLIDGPSDDYVLQAIGWRMLQEGQPGGYRLYMHAHQQLDLKPGMDSQEVHVVLRPGCDDHRPGRRARWPARPRCLDLQPGHPRSETGGAASLEE